MVTRQVALEAPFTLLTLLGLWTLPGSGQLPDPPPTVIGHCAERCSAGSDNRDDRDDRDDRSRDSRAESPADHAFRQGLTLLRAGQNAEAVAWFRQAIELGSTWSWTYNDLGLALLNMDRYDEALAALNEAVRHNPRHVSARISMGYCLVKLGRYAEAAEVSEQALRLDHSERRARVNLGTAYEGLGQDYAKQGRFAEAEDQFLKVIDLWPKYEGGYDNLRFAMHNEGYFATAEAAARRAVELDSKDAHLHNGLGATLESQGRPAEAQAEYAAALRLDPTFSNAGDNLRRVGTALEELEAAEHYGRMAALAVSPTSASALARKIFDVPAEGSSADVVDARGLGMRSIPSEITERSSDIRSLSEKRDHLRQEYRELDAKLNQLRERWESQVGDRSKLVDEAVKIKEKERKKATDIGKVQLQLLEFTVSFTRKVSQ